MSNEPRNPRELSRLYEPMFEDVARNMLEHLSIEMRKHELTLLESAECYINSPGLLASIISGGLHQAAADKYTGGALIRTMQWHMLRSAAALGPEVEGLAGVASHLEQELVELGVRTWDA